MLDKIFCKIGYWFFPNTSNDYRPKFLASRFLYIYAVSLVFLKLAVIPFFACFPFTKIFADLTQTSLFNITNETRVEMGLNSLAENIELDEAALLKAKDIIENDYFSHTSPSGLSPWYWFQQTGYSFKYAGENLAIGFLDSEEVNQAWLDSPSHRENLLNEDYTEMGLAVLTGDYQGQETTVVVQMFGTPKGTTIVENAVTTNTGEQQTVTETILPVEIAGQATEIVSVTEGNETFLAETTTEAAVAENASGTIQTREVLSAYIENTSEEKESFIYKLFAFVSSKYYTVLEQILYGSIIVIAFLLVITVLFDVFVYKAYEIQYKDIFLKALGFCAIVAILILFDKEIVISLIPRSFNIY